MKAFESFTGTVAPLNRANVDTDTIMPKQFLKAITREGLGPFLFDSWCYMDEGELGQDCAQRPRNPDFVLNQSRYKNASILLTRENFGCGSSREHAVWALISAGFRALIAPSFADIFYTNAVNNGLLPVVIDAESVNWLFDQVESTDGYSLAVDLDCQTLTTPDGRNLAFDIDASVRQRLLSGLDDIGVTLEYADDIRRYEQRRLNDAPWLFEDLRHR